MPMEIAGLRVGGLPAQRLAGPAAPPAVVALTPAAPRGIFPLCTLELLRVSLVHLHEFLLGRPIHPTPAEADALLFGRNPVAERRTAFERLVPQSGRMALHVAVPGVPGDAERVRGPMLVVAGREDRLTPARMVRKIAQKYRAGLRG